MRILLTLLFIYMSVPAFAAETAYFSALREMPVAPNLTEDVNSAVRFDQPEGRIIVMQASGFAQSAEITDFYNKTLPALGWKSTGTNSFSRDQEVLILDIKPLNTNGTKSGNRLNILVKPR